VKFEAIFSKDNLLRAFLLFGWTMLAYFIPNKFTFFQSHSVVLTPLDHMTPLIPSTIWIYISYYPFLIAAYFFASGHKKEQQVYIGAMALSAAIGCLIFIFFPTEIPRDLYPWLGRSDMHTRMLDAIREADRPVNCLPSMHVCMTLIAALTYSITSKRFWTKAFVWIWFLAICFSTMATKQHYFVDVLAGFGLGVSVCALMLQRYRVPFRQVFSSSYASKK
jgi:membrane-associated phospholipid phosphatase